MELITARKKESLKNAATQFPNAILIQPEKGSRLLLSSQIQKIMEIENLLRTHPYLKDSDGKINCRRLGDQNQAILLLFNENCDINIIKETIQQKMMEVSTQLKLPKLIIKVFEGNPLDTAGTIKVKVKNPDPNADKIYYQDFGEVENVVRKQGYDHIDYKSLYCFLPAAEEYYRIKKKKKEKQQFYFYLDPNEKNRAAPQYFIITKEYSKPANLQETLMLILHKFPINNNEEPKDIKSPATTEAPKQKKKTKSAHEDSESEVNTPKRKSKPKKKTKNLYLLQWIAKKKSLSSKRKKK